MDFTTDQRVVIAGLAGDTVYAFTNGRSATVIEVRRMVIAIRLDKPVTMEDVRRIFGANGTMFDLADDDHGHVITMTPRFLRPLTR